MIVLPGFVDTHRHLWESLMGGIGTDWTLDTYFQTLYLRGLGSHLRPEDAYIANLLGALQALDAGITTVLDWSAATTPDHADALIYGLRNSGARSVFAYGAPTLPQYWFSENILPHPEDSKRVRREYFSSDNQLMSMALAIRGPELSSMEMTKKDIMLARKLDVIGSMHVGVGVSGPRINPIIKLNEANLLGPDLNFVHCNTLSDEEISLIGQTGGSITVTPESECQLGLGLPATGRIFAHGIRPALGIDVIVLTGPDMFAQMKISLQVARALANESELAHGEVPSKLTLTARDALEFATIDGARALHLENKVGTLTPGKEADIIMLRYSDINLTPLNNPIGSVALCSNTSNVDSVFVAGKAVKRNGKLLNVDMSSLLRMAYDSRDYIFKTYYKTTPK